MNVETNTATEPEENVANATDVNVEAGPETVPTETVDYQEAPSASAVPVPQFTPQQPHAVPAPGIAAHPAPQNLKTLPQLPVAAGGGGSIPLAQAPPNHQIHSGHVQATTVRAVESAYFKQHQYIQIAPRPLAEVLGQGSGFFFLQESELDSPEVPNNNHQNAERPPVHQIGVSDNRKSVMKIVCINKLIIRLNKSL